jgi:hypothetical protein
MAQSVDHCDWGTSSRQSRSSARKPVPVSVGSRFFLGVFNALAIEVGVGSFIWLAIYVT